MRGLTGKDENMIEKKNERFLRGGQPLGGKKNPPAPATSDPVPEEITPGSGIFREKKVIHPPKKAPEDHDWEKRKSWGKGPTR